jgi:Flp pilus assembly protein protease CpaA
MIRVISVVGYLLFALFISYQDIRFRIIRNRYLLWFAGFTVAVNLHRFSRDTLAQITLVTLLLAALHLSFRMKIGAGDLKLFWIISFWSNNFLSYLQYFSLSWVLGGIVSVIFARNFHRHNGNIPFAPFIFTGFLASALPLVA